MRKVGLIGGIGPESTILYYRDIVYGVQEKTTKDFFPYLNIESLNVFDVFRYCQEKEYNELAEYILQAINRLALGGADFAVVTGNTPHIIFDQEEEQSPIPLISIVDSTRKEVEQQNFRKILLLGTRFTMTEDFFKKPFVQEGIELITPNENEIDYIDNKISKELEVGIINPDTQAEFIKIIERAKVEEGVQAVILGCTELPLILTDDVATIPYMDTQKIHVKAIIDEILR